MRNLILILVLIWGTMGTDIRWDSTPVLFQEQDSVYQIPRIPSNIQSPEDRIVYLLLHYWENIDFQQRTLDSRDQQLVNGFVNFLFVFPYVDADCLHQAVHNLLAAALVSEERVAPLMTLAHRYLYHPNSPLHNEEYYRVFVEEVLKMECLLSKADQSRLRFELSSMNMNRVGAQAADFEYLMDNGRRSSLYDMKDRYILLMFYDPACVECKTVLSHMLQSGTLEEQLKNKKLHLLAVAVEGSQLVPNGRDSTLPSTWHKAVLKNISELEDTYMLRAMPTLFLLDANKKVLLKDAPFQLIEKVLKSKERP